MNVVKKLIGLVTLLVIAMLPVAIARAQHGRVIVKRPAAKKGIQPDSEPAYGNELVYMFRVGSSSNSQPTDLIDCSLVGDPDYNVNYDSGGVNCYVGADSSGNFNLTGTFYQDCNSDSDIVYLEGRGGTVGGTSNSQFAVMGVPPSAYTCGYIYNNASSISFVLDDFTNVVAALAVGTFANYTNTPYDGISTYSASYAALGKAFDAANSIVSITNGGYGGSSSNVQQQLNTFADILASCVQGSGGTGSGSACGSLYTATTQGAFTSTHAPTDTWQSLASIAQYPNSTNTSTQLGLVPSTPPWTPYDSAVPSGGFSLQLPGAPVVTSASSSSARKSTSITIYGSNLIDTTTTPYTYPTVVVDAQAATVNTGSSTATALVITLPSHAGTGALGVYLEGQPSNFFPFTTTN